MLFLLKKWKLCLYLNGIYVGKVYIKGNETPTERAYKVHFWFKKQIFQANHVQSIVHPTCLLYSDEKKRELHYSFEYETGVEI